MRGMCDLAEAAPTRPSLRADRPPRGGEGERQRALVEARAWIGTPYRHRASVRGEGCDCLGLVRGVWRGLYGAEPEALPPYSPDWAERGGDEALLKAARRWLVQIPVREARAGDVLLFRMSAGVPVKHCGILGSCGGPEMTLIHAYWGRAVIESWMGGWWTRRIAAAFAWPEAPLPPPAGEGVEPQARRVGALRQSSRACVAEPAPPGHRFALAALPERGGRGNVGLEQD